MASACQKNRGISLISFAEKEIPLWQCTPPNISSAYSTHQVVNAGLYFYLWGENLAFCAS